MNLLMFASTISALFDGADDGGEIVVRQDHVGRFDGRLIHPLTPIATPISARLSAGASFTPSPVMATILTFGLLRCDYS